MMKKNWWDIGSFSTYTSMFALACYVARMQDASARMYPEAIGDATGICERTGVPTPGGCATHRLEAIEILRGHDLSTPLSKKTKARLFAKIFKGSEMSFEELPRTEDLLRRVQAEKFRITNCLATEIDYELFLRSNYRLDTKEARELCDELADKRGYELFLIENRRLDSKEAWESFGDLSADRRPYFNILEYLVPDADQPSGLYYK